MKLGRGELATRDASVRGTFARRVVTRRAAVAALIPLIAACGGAGVGGDDGQPDVVASIYPLKYAAQRIAGQHADVTLLTSPGVEPHDLELSVMRTAELSEADLVIYQKGFQPAVDEAVEENGPDRAIDAGEVVELQPAGHDEDESAQEHADHEHGDTDPHFWLDPARLATVAGVIKRQLVELDPDHAGVYEKNLLSLKNDLDDLDAEYHKGLAHCEVDTVVVSHDAFGYLSKYGLHFEAINGLSPDAEPSPAHIAEIHDLIATEHISTVFSETLASKAMSEAVARDLDIKTAVLDPIEGLSDVTADEDYLSLMRHNLAALQEANRCR